LLLSIVALAFNTHGEPLPLVAYLMVLGAGVLHPALLRHWGLWATIVVVQGGLQVVFWEGVDDHVVVGTYWALVVGLGLLTGHPERTMCLSARWLIGLVFVFAAGWKLASPEFRDGTFFSLYLVADPRFRLLADVVGGVEAATFEGNRRLIGSLYEVGQPMLSVTLGLGPRLRWLAMAMTAWGIFIESLTALAWLLPLRGAWRNLRHALLFVFCATTYGLVAITGFGTILLVMGMATVDPRSRWRGAYALGVVALALWTPLWRVVVLG
jgi:hypothetical protein